MTDQNEQKDYRKRNLYDASLKLCDELQTGYKEKDELTLLEMYEVVQVQDKNSYREKLTYLGHLRVFPKYNQKRSQIK